MRGSPVLRGCWLLLALAALHPQAALGHQSSVVYSDISASGRTLRYTLQIANADLYEALGLGKDRPASREEAERGKGRISAYLLSHLHVQNHGLPCPGQAESSDLIDKADGFFVVQQLSFQCPRSIEEAQLTYDLFFDLDPRHQGLCHVRAFGAETEHVFRGSSRTLELRHALTRWDNARDYLELGIEHIFTGYDHLAFLFCLLVLAGSLSRRGPEAQKGPGAPGLRHVVKVVTAFTLAHSVTLILSALGWVRLPSRPVEAIIALSIGYVAAENILRPRPRHRFLLTFCFGLVHGFGFASVLREIGLPRTGLLLSLVSFNLGVELGQLLVVGMVFPLLHLLAVRDGARYRAAELFGIAVLSALSLVVFSRFGLPWAQLLLCAVAAPAALLLGVRRRGYDRAVRVGGSAVVLLLSLLWLVERVASVTLLRGALG